MIPTDGWHFGAHWEWRAWSVGFVFGPEVYVVCVGPLTIGWFLGVDA